jgi:hypothetical protein
MKPIWFVVLVTLLLLPASRLWAQPDLAGCGKSG